MKKMMSFLMLMFTVSLISACGAEQNDNKPDDAATTEKTAIADSTTDSAVGSSATDSDLVSIADKTVVSELDVFEPKDEGNADDSMNEVGKLFNNPANVDWHDYYDGEVLDLDAYAEALGYTVSDLGSNVSEQYSSELLFYNFEKNGRRYSISNNRFTMGLLYFLDDGRICSILFAGAERVTKQGIKMSARGMRPKILREELAMDIVATMKYFMTTDEIDPDALPVHHTYSVVYVEAADAYYDENNNIILPADTDSLTSYKVTP